MGELINDYFVHNQESLMAMMIFNINLRLDGINVYCIHSLWGFFFKLCVFLGGDIFQNSNWLLCDPRDIFMHYLISGRWTTLSRFFVGFSLLWIRISSCFSSVLNGLVTCAYFLDHFFIHHQLINEGINLKKSS
jgi:hypothetical protein